jgi:hypothetical protein
VSIIVETHCQRQSWGIGRAATLMVSAARSLPGPCQPGQCLDHRLARGAQSSGNGCRPEPKLMKMKGFRGDALIAWGSRGVRQNSRERKFGFSSNSLRSGPPTSSPSSTTYPTLRNSISWASWAFLGFLRSGSENPMPALSAHPNLHSRCFRSFL